MASCARRSKGGSNVQNHQSLAHPPVKMKKHIVLNTLISFIVGFVFLFLLTIARVRGIISPREHAIGMLAWAVALVILMTVLGRRSAKQLRRSLGGLSAEDGDTTRKCLRDIRATKVWAGVLAVLLLIGIVNGISKHAWLPTIS